MALEPKKNTRFVTKYTLTSGKIEKVVGYLTIDRKYFWDGKPGNMYARMYVKADFHETLEEAKAAVRKKINAKRVSLNKQLQKLTDLMTDCS